MSSLSRKCGLLSPTSPLLLPRFYATKRDGPPPRAQNITDPRFALIKSILYEKESGDASSPSNVLVQNKVKAEMVERAWTLVQQQRKQLQQDDLRRKYWAMRRAMDELEKTDSRLFQGAMDNADAEVQTFSTRLRVRTETPPTSI